MDSKILPDHIRELLKTFATDLSRAAGDNLKCILLYGGLARGSYHEGLSDVNVALILEDTSMTSLRGLANVLNAARRTAGVECLVLDQASLEDTARVFPAKFIDIQQRHIVLYGSDPFDTLHVSRTFMLLRVEQELRNLLMRLRSRYLQVHESPVEMLRTLRTVARPLALQCEALLRLRGEHEHWGSSTEDIFQRAAGAFGLDAQVLGHLAMLRHGIDGVEGADDLYDAVCMAITEAAAVAARHRGA